MNADAAAKVAVLRVHVDSITTQPLSVSYAQRRMWLLQQLEPGSVAYSVPLALRLDGPLDTVALAGALDAWVQRHEAFRTSFVLRGAERRHGRIERLA